MFKGENMKTENRRRFIINVLYVVTIIAIVFFAFKYALFALAPFVVAFIISSLLQPIIRFLKRTTHLKQRPLAIVTLILFICTVGTVVVCIGIEVVILTKDLVAKAPEYYTSTVQPALTNLIDHVQSFLRNFDADISLDYKELVPKMSDLIPSFSTIFDTTTEIIVSVPTIFISVLVGTISTFFMCVDYPLLTRWVLYQIPEKTRHTVIEVKKYVTEILFKYIRSYALILSITFCELCILFLIAGLIETTMFPSVGMTIFYAFIIALFDILPIVGTGTVLIPWGVISILLGDYRMGIMLFIIYLIITVIRHTIEPKIIGNQVGLHPVVTLMAMIVGTSLFGVLGLFGLPITIALLKDLNDKGKIHIFKYLPKDENLD